VCLSICSPAPTNGGADTGRKTERRGGGKEGGGRKREDTFSPARPYVIVLILRSSEHHPVVVRVIWPRDGKDSPPKKKRRGGRRVDVCRKGRFTRKGRSNRFIKWVCDKTRKKEETGRKGKQQLNLYHRSRNRVRSYPSQFGVSVRARNVKGKKITGKGRETASPLFTRNIFLCLALKQPSSCQYVSGRGEEER